MTPNEAQQELAWMDRRIAELEQRNARLTWALRAIDCRLHKELNASLIWVDDEHEVISTRTLRQMCNVAVSATAERPEDV